MSAKACVPCQRALAPGELAHLHMTRFYAVGGHTFWTYFPTTRMLRLFEQGLSHVRSLLDLLDAVLVRLAEGPA